MYIYLNNQYSVIYEVINGINKYLFVLINLILFY